MASHKISPELLDELKRLALLRDDEIDTSDIPETLDWSGAERGRFATRRISHRSYDVRAIANWFLDHQPSSERPFSNLALNKLVYLAVERSLVERHVLLTPARVEAWSHGPVFREVYQAFKDFGDRAITTRAKRFSVDQRQMVEAYEKFSSEDEEFLLKILRRFGERTAAQLRALSHVTGGPWYTVWHYRGHSNPGMEITTAIILQHAPDWRDSDEA